MFEHYQSMRINSLGNKYCNYNNQYSSVSFKANNPLSMQFLRGLKNVTCAYCGQEMLTFHQIEDYAIKASRLTGQRLAKLLSSYESKMKDTERQTVTIIKEALKKNPHCDLKGVLEKIFPHHVKRLESQQIGVLEQIQEMSKTFSPNDRVLVGSKIKDGYKVILQSGEERHFKRNRYISDFYFLRDKFENKKDHERIMTLISSMPNTHTSPDALIVKYSRKSSKEIATRLLITNQSTIEHLHPRSQGGKNDLSNLVLACGKDNSSRSSRPLDDMPQIEINLPEYFRTLKKALAKKLPVHEFKKVNEYIEGVKETVNSLLSNGLHIVDNSKGR